MNIQAVTVNHNTSHFVELMLRTLFLLNDRESFRFNMTVLDNASNDSELPALKSYLAAANIPFQQTGFDAAIAPEKHGAALQSFVLQEKSCDYYLFLDSDMWFIEPNTIRTMLEELETAGEDVFANQARIAGYYAGRIIEGENGIPGASDMSTWVTSYEHQEYQTSRVPRCSPVCSLFKNTQTFRRVVETIGFTPTLQFIADGARYFDTFGLLTQVMCVHGQRFIISSQTVNHFTQASYMPEHRTAKDRDCILLLQDLRAGRGVERENFYESNWVKQRRQKNLN